MSSEHEIKQELPNPWTYIPDNATMENDFSAGEYHFVLWAHNLTFDFTIESAEVDLIATERDLFRFRTHTEGDWDYDLHLRVRDVISYTDAEMQIEANHEFIEILGSATTWIFPNNWQVTTRIGENECPGYTTGSDSLRFEHRGTGDLGIEAHTEQPRRGHRMTLWIFDVPLDPPEPYCRK